MLYPLKFHPIYKEMVWGGSNLRKRYNKQISYENKVGESWELANREDGMSIVKNGLYKGKTFQEVIDKYPVEFLGVKYKDFINRFPLLIKIIDAADDLSIQVHPTGEDGKTEAWYILHAEDGASIIYGLKENMQLEVFEQLLYENKVEDCLNKVAVMAGDMFLIPAGNIHAIGKGIVVAEVQQNSNTTYRLYDYNRPGLDGKLRELHIDKALPIVNLNVLNTEFHEEVCCCDEYEMKKLINCEYFNIDKFNLKSRYVSSTNGHRFEIIIPVNGDVDIIYNKTELLKADLLDTIFIPAALGEYEIVGQCEFLKIYL